ncbi:MAG: hypothetical protein ICV77_17540 [Cyanobacteria bacterium Co-bin8]|nr:hypothetical protein [Cyanobacteria bacterium Co-bin8]
MNSVYPVRLFIRNKARDKLLEALGGNPSEVSLDGPLLWDVTNTLLQPTTSPNLYRPYPSRDLAAQVEEQTADEIASAYIRIKQQATNPLVQRLNQLL